MSSSLAIVDQLTSEELERFTALAEKFEQQKTGSVNNKINCETIGMTDHAISRARERFNMNNDGRGKIVSYFRELLSRCQFITDYVAVDEKGVDQKSLLYGAKGGIEITVSSDYKTIITVNKHGGAKYSMPEFVKKQIISVYTKELRKLNKIEKSKLKRLSYFRAEADAEIYPLRFIILKTTSKKKKSEAESRINEIEANMSAKFDEIIAIQSKIRQVGRSMTTIL